MPPLARRYPDLVAWLGVGLLVAFTWTERGPSHALQWPWYLYAQVLVLTPVLWFLTQVSAAGHLHRLGGTLDWALLGFAVAMTAAALLSSHRETCLALLPTVLVPVTTVYAVAQWLARESRGDRRRRLEDGGALFLALASGISLAGWGVSVLVPQLSAGAPLSKLFNTRNEWLLGHSVYTAGLGLLTTTWCAGLARERQGTSRTLWLAGAALGFVNLFSSGSRSGFIGLGLWFIWLFVTEVRAHRWPLRRALLAGIAILAAAAGLTLLHPRTRVIIAEWRSSGTLNTGDRQRLAMAEFGALVLREHPLLGIGPGATPQVYPAYRARLSGGVEAALQLHSTPVQWAADAGLVGLATAGLAAFALWRRRRRAPSTFAAGALLAYAGLAFTDYQLDLPVFAFALGVLIALCTVPGIGNSRPIGRRVTLGVGAALAAAVVGYGTSQIRPLQARNAFALAVEALTDGDRESFETGMASVYRFAPDTAFYRNLHACLLADVRAYPFWFPPIDFGPDRLARADQLLQRSLAIDPEQELPHTHLAWHAVDSRPAEAIQHFRSAAQLIPDKGSLYFGQALAFVRLGRQPEAIRALALELVNDPAFVTSPEWAQAAGLRELASAARQAAARQLERIAQAAPPNDPLGYARRARYSAALLRWLDGDDAALAAALRDAEPLQQEILNWLGGQSVTLAAEPDQAWQYLAAAAAQPQQSAAIIAKRYPKQAPTTESLEEMAAALATKDRRELLRGGALRSPGTQPRIQRERAGYPLLLRNLDAPAPRDPYLVPLNRLVRDFFFPLFPEKGYLPGPVLRQAQSDLGL
ncbi:MAG: O-antigen ligase family protein [Opitutaceae bacterium]